ncbi:hypothetical protein AS132_18160 [Photobacterium sanguinicancri]|nr:hypothetical protein AS132_18160 [Photobacterium sanguinicancri]
MYLPEKVLSVWLFVNKLPLGIHQAVRGDCERLWEIMSVGRAGRNQMAMPRDNHKKGLHWQPLVQSKPDSSDCD